MFFYMKYFVFFGMPSVFARLDRMQSQPPPICIARVSLYSKARSDGVNSLQHKTFTNLAPVRPRSLRLVQGVYFHSNLLADI